ncbi:MAG TPA: winged helix-turn-helix domain-containing protein [Terriglobales bacterium]|nr:winged helix-turn-helix domain-containing protein [Terriglobales bacterium]
MGRRFVFSALVFDAESGELTRNGSKLRLPGQAARILAILLEYSGQLVTREDLRRSLWPADEFLDYDHSINNSVSQLRDALRDDSRTPRFIETIPKRGYRFLADVKIVPDLANDSNPAVEKIEASKPDHPVEILDRRPWRRKWLPAVAAAVVIVLAVVALVISHKAPSTQRQDAYIGIAPFEVSGEDAEQLAESFRLDLTDAVSQLPAVQVRAAHSFPKGQRDDTRIPALARNLQIDTLLFGKFTVQGDDCLLQFELVRGRDAIHLASLQYRGTKSELAAIRDKAQRDIFTHLALAPNTERAVRGNTENPRAYEAYLRARYHLSQWTDDSVAKSLSEFESAISEDPAFAKAYSGMASAHFVLAQHEAEPKKESFRRAKELAAKAIALDPSVAEAHAMLGQIALNQDWNFSLAEKELRQAVELDPNQAIYHLWFSILLCVENRFEESLQQIDLAHSADSFWPPVYMTEVFLAGAARQYERSIDSGKKLIALMPDWSLAYDQLGLTLWYAGRQEEAIDSWRKMAILEKDTARIKLEDRGLQAFRRGGVPAYAQVRIDAAKSGTHWAHSENDFDLAEWYVYAGSREQSIQALEAKVARHDPGALQIAINPSYEDLHQDPRFLALLTRIGIALPRTYPKPLLNASLK